MVKLHIRSGKVSLMGYDDFNKPIPFMVERVKIKMAEQDVDYFDYIDERSRPPLLNKSYLMPSNDLAFKTQRSLEKRLEKIIGADLSQQVYIKRQQFEDALKNAGVSLKGFKLMKAS